MLLQRYVRDALRLIIIAGNCYEVLKYAQDLFKAFFLY